MSTSHHDSERRFGGIRRLYGDAGLKNFREAHVCVIGIGGVGSWAAEALARSAVGRITLIDLDHVAESNINRQLHALSGTVGQAKVQAMAERIRQINPDCRVEGIEAFIDADNLAGLLGRGYDYVIDCIDGFRIKAALIAWCRRNKVRLVTVGGAGGQTDPTRIRIADLSNTEHDALFSKTRKLLRTDYGFPRNLKRRFDIPCVYSDEQPLFPAADGGVCHDKPHRPAAGLNCAGGLGSAMTVTATFGLAGASHVLKKLATGGPTRRSTMPVANKSADNAGGRWLALLLAAVTLLGGCATHRLQPDTGKQRDYALPPAAAGPLHELAERAARGTDEDESLFLSLSSNVEALKWRMLLADLATQSIDIQYYLLDRDEGSKLLGRHLVHAAERGVQIRILVDDVFTGARDRNIVLWDRHPNISIRVFNPWHKRGSLVQQALEFLGYAERLNRRMHNKLFVVDGRIVISGGRNIGNSYFGLGSNYNFRDLEVVVTGPLVEQVADSFDLYWNDDWTVSAAAFAAAGKPSETREEMYERRSRALDESEKLRQAGLLEPPPVAEYLQRFIDSAIHGEAWVVYDDPPSKVLEEQGVRKIEQLEELDADISREVLIVSPYFIPSEIFMGKLQGLTDRGVRVSVLTNSLASTNHTMVHSGYRPWRRKLLEAGVELYEYRADAGDTADIIAPGVDSRFVALHTKTFILDREIVYIGSLNMDPRSFHLNTEIGLLIAAPELAESVARLVERDMSPENAWRVSLDDEGRLTWDSSHGTTRLQPARGLGQRTADFFYGLLPIKDQL